MERTVLLLVAICSFILIFYAPTGFCAGRRFLNQTSHQTHFYTVWTRDGTKTTCYNTKCPGFQPEGGASIVPGGIIDTVTQLPNGVKQKLSLKLLKDSASGGDWLLYYGLNRDADELIGRFPKSIFTGLADKATDMQFGGIVAGQQNQVPMGSGFLPPSAAAASFTNVQLVDSSGQASLVTRQLPRLVTDPNLYDITPIANGAFSYRGPSNKLYPRN
ncbi:hypothetical protein BS78_03G151000 [Paspalum vaginatum]|nr:hypothetical protein BS78_03G151000 [Paspalum vaginatum]